MDQPLHPNSNPHPSQSSPWDDLASQASAINDELERVARATRQSTRTRSAAYLQLRLVDVLGADLIERLGLAPVEASLQEAKWKPQAPCKPFGIQASFVVDSNDGLVLQASPSGCLWTSSHISGEDTLALALEDLQGRVQRAAEQKKVFARQSRLKELKEALKKAEDLDVVKELAKQASQEYPAYGPTISGLLKSARDRLFEATRRAQYAKDHEALQEALWGSFTAYRVSYFVPLREATQVWGGEDFPTFPTLIVADDHPRFDDWWECLGDASETFHGIPEDMSGIQMVRILSVATVKRIDVRSWKCKEAYELCAHVEYPTQDGRVFTLLLPPKGATGLPCGRPMWHETAPSHHSRAKEEECFK